MKRTLLFIFSLYFSYSTAQETALILNKVDQNKFNIDGVVSNEEINKAKILEIIYEAEPGLNSMPSQETTGYITYSDKFLYVGIKGKRERVIAPLTTRDNSVLFRGDFAGIHQKSKTFRNVQHVLQIFGEIPRNFPQNLSKIQ